MTQNQRLLITSRPFPAVIFAVIVLSFSILSSPAAAQEQTVPQGKPNAEIGLQIFAERCAACHGPTGAGDGEMAANLAAPPAALSNPEYRKTAEPGAMFAQIFSGDFAAGMPPFGPGTENSNPISESNIWDLVAAVYSLSTPVQSIGMGEAIYEGECLACHGVSGIGDGPSAGELDGPLPDLTDAGYWFSRSNETVYESIQSGAIPAHDYDLSETVQWTVVDYARSFAYAFAESAAPVQAVASATIGGEVRNGTSDEIVSGVTAQLRAFTASFQETLNITSTVGTDGRYEFDLELIPTDWIFLASIAYEGLSFSSDAAQLSGAQTELDLPITVYEQTTSSAAVSIDQAHIILEFFEGGLAVSELYVFSNREAAVFVGETGDTEDGTVHFSLPDNAENIGFERTMGSMDTTIPASEIIQTGSGWADTLPLRPGQGGLNLIVRYELPYDDGATLSHQYNYDASSVTVIIPDVGVELAEDDWVFQGAQQMSGAASFLTYDQADISSGGTVELNLSGAPSAVSGPEGTVAVVRNQTSELLFGATLFVVAIAVAFFVVRRWRMPEAEQDTQVEDDRDDAISALLRAIASLDEAYAEGDLEQEPYETQREQLKSELRMLWG